MAADVDPRVQLGALQRMLDFSGLHTCLRMPDDEDPLGGVLVVWATVDEDGAPADVVEVLYLLQPQANRQHARISGHRAVRRFAG